MQAAERDYDLNRAAELKYGTLLQLQRQLKDAEEKLAEKVWLLSWLHSERWLHTGLLCHAVACVLPRGTGM